MSLLKLSYIFKKKLPDSTICSACGVAGCTEHSSIPNTATETANDSGATQ